LSTPEYHLPVGFGDTVHFQGKEILPTSFSNIHYYPNFQSMFPLSFNGYTHYIFPFFGLYIAVNV